MMKWGEKKPSSASSSSSSSSSHHASPFHWLSKFKKMSIKHKAKEKSPSSIGSPRCSFVNGVDDDNDNALTMESFCEEGVHVDNKKSEDFTSSSSCISGRSNANKHGKREDTPKLKKKDIGVGEEKILLNDKKVSKEMEEYNREKEYESLRRRFEEKAQIVLQEQLVKLEKEAKEVEKGVMKFESPTTICTPRTHSFVSSASSKDSSLRSIVENRVYNRQNFEKIERPSQKKLSYEGQSLRQIEELRIKTNKQKQLVHHVNREIQRRKPKHSKVRIYSPRLASRVELCKIKAIEDMRKAKLKVKKERKEVVDETEGIDSFAVIKCSTDPKKDFRDSMIEMITEKQINKPEQMEELLACYLTLNTDEYHDLIIKVFRQLWFDMSQDGLCIKSDMSCYFGYDD